MHMNFPDSLEDHQHITEIEARGPSLDPCGTPQFSFRKDDVVMLHCITYSIVPY